MKHLGVAALLLATSVGCAGGGRFWPGLAMGSVFHDPDDALRRANFDGYVDRWEAHDGSQAVAAQQTPPPVTLPAAPDP